MTAIDDELKALQTKISAAQNAQARAQVESDNATDTITASWDTLRKEFGVSTMEDAKSLLVSLNRKRQTSIQAVKDALTEAGA